MVAAAKPLVNLELHGIDVLDAHDGLADLAPTQRDLAVPVATKRAVLRAIVEDLRAAGYTFVTLDAAAEAFSA